MPKNPHKISIATYTLRVRHKQSGGRWERLNSFDENRGNFLNLFEEFSAGLMAAHAHDEESKLLQRAERVECNHDSIWGILKAGDYGYGADLVDVDSYDVSHRRVPKEAELLPFYFLLHVPGDSNKALLLMQRHGSRGAFTALTAAFRKYFESKHPEYTVEIRPHIPQPVLDYLEKGYVKSIRLTKYRVPSDLAEKIRFGGNVEDVAVMTIQVKAKRNRQLPKPPWLAHLLKERPQLVEASEILGDLADRISVTVRYNGNERTVDFSRPEAIAPYVDVTEQVELGEDGHPKFDSIHEHCRGLLSDLLAEIGKVE